MCDSLHGQFHPHGLLAAMHLKNQQTKKAPFLPAEQQPNQGISTSNASPGKQAPLDLGGQRATRQTPRLSLAQVKKAAAYPSAAAARSSLRRPSVTSAPEISQTLEENEASPTADVPPVLIPRGDPVNPPLA
jgi:hypothetical protein